MTIEFFCSICTKVYENADRICTLPNCGHVFHENCLSQQVGHGYCPECHHFCKNRIKLNIRCRKSKKIMEITEEPGEKVINIIDLEKNLTIGQEQIHQLMHDKELSKILLESLENKINEQNILIKTLRADFERKKKDDEESHKISLQSLTTPTPTVTTTPTLTLTPPSTSIPTLTLTPPTKPIAEKISENSNPMNCTYLDVIAKKDQLINELVRNSNEKSLELEKEIRNSTMLIVEKMKLHQQMIDAGISADGESNQNQFQDSTNKLNHQVRKSLQISTVVPGSWRSKEQATYDVKISLKDANTTGPVAATESTRCDLVITGGTKKRFGYPDFDLFRYAQKLRKVGFKNYFFYDSKMFAQKDGDLKEHEISSKDDVHILLVQFLDFDTEGDCM